MADSGFVIGRRIGEAVVFTLESGEVRVELDSIQTKNQVRLRVSAPRHVRIMREELIEKDEEADA